MPSAKRAIDVLWQTLRPIKSQTSLQGLITFRRCQLRPTLAQSFPIFPTRPRIGPWSLPRSINLQAQRCVHWQHPLIAQHVRDQALIRDLDITSAYQELRRIVLKANYTHIRNCVRILVKERDQKPNLRLYDALLLANTDSQCGSAAEVARILDEIAAEGLTADSATYHAALRVGKLGRNCHVCFNLHRTGSCNTSRLSIKASYTRTTTAAMVLFDQSRLARCGPGPSQRRTSRACA